MAWNILIQDSFTDVNGTSLFDHTPEIGGQWTPSGDGSIYNNRAIVAYNVRNSIYASTHDCYAQAFVYLGTDGNFDLYINTYPNNPPNPPLDGDRFNKVWNSNNLYLNGVIVGTFVNNSIYRIERLGNTVYAYRDGLLLGSAAAVGIGYYFTIGIDPYIPGDYSYLDNFEAGEYILDIPTAPSNLTATCMFSNLPVASISTAVSSGIAPLTVQFTDTSTGTPTSWLWEWGDGTANGTTQNPSHIFTTAGIYTVKLTATNAYGNTSYVKTIQINSVQIELTTLPPIASFTADAKIIVPGTTVNFTDTSTGGTATSWSWKANGVGFATTQNASHLFTDAGIYIIIFTVTDAGGLSSTTMQTIVVTSDIDPSDNIPLAKITPDKTSGFAPTTINFSATVSTPDIFYLWDFGDGSTSPSASVSHTYMKGGIYTVTLTVSNIYGSTVTTMTIVMADVRYADLSIVGYYIIDRVNNRILIYGKTGTLLSSFGGKGSQVGKFNMPTCVLVNRG